jgi:predicted metal-dependent hydrolase
MGVKPCSVRIGSARSRWGSCSASGRINYSWFIIMGDARLIDYLVIHELAHMKHLNHSAQFWEEVAKYEPEARVQRKKLRELQEKINSEGW